MNSRAAAYRWVIIPSLSIHLGLHVLSTPTAFKIAFDVRYRVYGIVVILAILPLLLTGMVALVEASCGAGALGKWERRAYLILSVLGLTLWLWFALFSELGIGVNRHSPLPDLELPDPQH